MEAIVQKQKQYFNNNTTRPLSFRIGQLKKLKSVLIRYEQELTKAISLDFQKGGFNTFLTEFTGLYVDLDKTIKKVGKWAKTRRVGNNMLNVPGSSLIIPEPLGVCLIIAAWNYPVNLTIAPAIGAIAGGNTIVLKPSELASHTSAVLAGMIRENFDPSFFTVVEGGIKETTELLEQKFDKIFFTGSVAVGKVVYQAAAKNLIPVTLELGGKSPLVVAPDANLKICIKRLVWGKFINAGQTCIAPDYVMVHKSIETPFLELLKKEITSSQFSLANQNYAQIISEKHFDRMMNLIPPEKIFTGGEYDRANRFLAPTVLINISPEDKVMEDEIFGPILPVLTYEDINSAVTFIKSKPKPLAFYVFSESSSLCKKLLNEISFGGGAVNDVLMHFSNDQLPFGGVGHSGMGNYHGEAGFRNFSHYKSVLHKPTWFEFPLKYYPYSNWKLAIIKRVIGL
ncbi:MAG TPA: aldehyde dehydrogenase [Chitinophagaceae bacterium]|nr:aldehyde dehydrogenase [Chitinophagaceae bacterium]